MYDSTPQDGGESGLPQYVANALYRSTAPGDFLFYRDHPLDGPEAGDFHLPRTWAETPSVNLCLGRLWPEHSDNNRSLPRLEIEVREFKLTECYDPNATDLRKGPMFAYPRAIVDPAAVTKSLADYTTKIIPHFLESIQNSGSAIDRHIFGTAPELKDPLVLKAIRLRAASQFMQSGWVYELGKMGNQTIAGLLPGVPEQGWPERMPISGYVDYQFASIIVPYLRRLAKEILSELVKKVLKPGYDPSLRFTFLILLTCPQSEFVFQARFAERRKCLDRYTDMDRITELKKGAQALLRIYDFYQHYCSSPLDKTEVTLIKSVQPPDGFDASDAYTYELLRLEYVRASYACRLKLFLRRLGLFLWCGSKSRAIAKDFQRLMKELGEANENLVAKEELH